MVSYGPWIQDPDYLQFQSSSASTATPDVESVTYAGPYQDPVDPLTDTELSSAVAAARGAVLAQGAQVSYASSYQLAFPNWQTQYGITVENHLYPVATREFSYNPANYFPRDPAAIGIDYEGEPYDPTLTYPLNLSGPASVVAMSIGPETILRGYWKDLQRAPADGDAIPWASETRLVLIDGGAEIELPVTIPGQAVASYSNAAERTLDTAIDITAYRTDDAWTAQVAATTTPAYISPSSTAPYASTEIAYGWRVWNLRINHTVRPPRYRWVYPGDPPAIRRIHPRDDELGAGSPRTFPRSRSRQSSNRTSGAIF